MAFRKSILFVCMGNICRSPAAAGVLIKMAAEQGLAEQLRIESAGTIGYHAGEPADARMRGAAARRGYDLQSRSRPVRESDFAEFDLILAMDRENLAALREFRGAERHPEKLKLFGEFLDGAGRRDVPDPYYGGAAGFERVLDLLETGCRVLLRELAAERDRAAPGE